MNVGYTHYQLVEELINFKLVSNGLKLVYAIGLPKVAKFFEFERGTARVCYALEERASISS